MSNIPPTDVQPLSSTGSAHAHTHAHTHTHTPCHLVCVFVCASFPLLDKTYRKAHEVLSSHMQSCTVTHAPSGCTCSVSCQDVV